MLDDTLVASAAGLVTFWGVSHLMPTRQVIAAFGEISTDNRRVLTMEWVAEGLAMIFAGVLIALVTATAGSDDRTRWSCTARRRVFSLPLRP